MVSGARSVEKILLLQPRRAQRGEKFFNAGLGHPFSLVSGARSAGKILLLQPRRVQRTGKFCNARLGHPFSLESGAHSAEKILLGHHWAALVQKNTKVERFIGIKHEGRAKKSLQKAFFGNFLQKPEPRAILFFM